MFTVLTLTAIVSVFYSLTLLDNMVNGSLYHYGLQFSYDWANQYWMTLRVAQALLGLTVVLTLVNMIYVFKKYCNSELRMPKIQMEPRMPKIETKLESKKPEVKLTVSERVTRSPSTSEQQSSSIPSGLVKCGHCGKIFAQPLRMLDFHEDRPRMVNICPFCNEIIRSAPRL